MDVLVGFYSKVRMVEEIVVDRRLEDLAILFMVSYVTIGPELDTPNRPKGYWRRSALSWMQTAARTGHKKAVFARPNATS